MRGEISLKLADYSSREQIAFSYNDQMQISFKDFISRMQIFKSFILENNFKPGTRIAVVGLSLEYHYPFAVTILDYLTLVMFEISDLNGENFSKYECDFILTEEGNFEIINFALKNRLSYIENNNGTLKRFGSNRFDHNEHSEICSIIPTSGTTSEPKLIAKTHESLIESCKNFSIYDYSKDTIYLQSTPLERVITLNYFLYVIYYGGTSMVAQVNFDDLIEIIMSNRITIYKTVPSVLVKLLQYFELKNKKYSNSNNLLKFISVGGARIDDGLHEKTRKLLNTELVHTYGSNEAGNIASTFKNPRGFKKGSVGIIMNHNYKIHDGEILVKGPTVFRGYLNASNEEVFIDGYFRTGDSGYIDEDGYLFITGRIKEMINRGGEKVSPYEVEDKVMALGKYEECAVFPFPGENGVEEVGLIVALKAGKDEESIIELRKKLSQSVPSFKLPTKLIYVKAIEKASSGKIQRKRLYEIYQDHFEKVEIKFEEVNTIEGTLTNIWKKVLKKSTITSTDTFIDLGGDSLKAAELFSLIEIEFNLELEILELLKHKTISDMLIYIQSNRKKKNYKYIERLKSGDDNFNPIFFFHNGTGNSATYQKLAKTIKTKGSIYSIVFNQDVLKENKELNSSDIISLYINEIKMIQSSGTYYFAGSSSGGKIGLEVAYYFGQNQQNIKCFLFDTIFVKKSKLQRTLSGFYHFINVLQYDLKINNIKNLSTILKHKVKMLIKGFVLRDQYKKLNRLSYTKKIENSEDLNQEELTEFINYTFQGCLHEKYPVDVIYLLALKEHNTDSYDYIKDRVKSIKRYDINCVHGKFVSSHVIETARIIESYVNETN